MTASAPALTVELGPAAPGWVLRAVVPVLVLGCAAVVGGGAVVWTLATVLALTIAWQPAVPAAPFLPLLVATWLVSRPDLLSGAPAEAVRLALLVLMTHLVVRLGALAAHVAWAARIELAVLGTVLRGMLPVQLPVQVLLVVTWGVRAALDGATAGTLRWVAVPAVVLLVLLALPRAWVRR